MAQCIVGDQNFQKGLQLYMKRHAYGNTRTTDLWNAWTEVSSGIDVAALMHSWTSKMGHPYLKVVSEQWSNDSVTFTLEQNWFLADGSEGDSSMLWSIPLIFATSVSESDNAVIMHSKQQTFTIALNGAEDWVKINAGQKALARVAHSKEMIRRLLPAIQSKQSLGAIDRGALLLDAYALAKAGYVGVEDVISILSAMKDEDTYTVWASIAGVLGGLSVLMEEIGGDAYEAFLTFAKAIVKSALTRVGWDAKPTDGHSENLLRSTVIGLLDTLAWNDPEIVAEARRRFDGHFEDPALLPAEYKVRNVHLHWYHLADDGDRAPCTALCCRTEERQSTRRSWPPSTRHRTTPRRNTSWCLWAQRPALS